MKNITISNYTPIQLKLPVDYEKIIEINDEVYTFNEVMEHINLKKYFAEKESKTGRPKYDPEKLLKVILFAFMEDGYTSLRKIEKLCKTDIRYMWILDDEKPPSFMTIGNFINNELNENIEKIFADINRYIFEKEKVDMKHAYIDGTKMEANANKYSWVWKKSCVKNRSKVFAGLTELIEKINEEEMASRRIKFEVREEYAVEYVEEIMKKYLEITGIKVSEFVYGRGTRKTPEQKYYEKLEKYCEKLKKYSNHIKICGDKRNSYSKTDHDATFMRVKKDYMGNDQLLPAYNLQLAVCDEYIAVYDVFQYASDMDCFQPLMESFKEQYGSYPEYPVADAGYGSYNNYLFCEKNGMKKFMKFTMYEKETHSSKYRDDPFRACNFKIDDEGYMVCPGEKRFEFLKTAPIRGNQYGRTEEYYQCEDCEGCIYREKCHKSENNRIVQINKELTSFHNEVIGNLNSVQGALLRMNRSIQSEGAYGTIKWNKNYKRINRRGMNSVLLELGMIFCGFNLHKFHLKKSAALKAA